MTSFMDGPEYPFVGYEPSINCKHPRCWNLMVLPSKIYPAMRSVESDDSIQGEIYKHRSSWPPDDWRASIGCPACGNILQYVADDVEWDPIEYDEATICYADTVCYSVSGRCAKSSCPVPVLFHIVLDSDQNDPEGALRDRLRDAFYIGKCVAGHPLLPVPQILYRLNRIFDVIPSDSLPSRESD